MKRKFTLLLIIPCLIAGLSSCKKDTDPIEEPKTETKTDPKVTLDNVSATLGKTTTASIFTELVKTTVLTEADVKDGITVLAPTDQAVNAYRKGNIAVKSVVGSNNTINASGKVSVSGKISAVADSNVVKFPDAVLKDHIIKGILKPEDLVDGKTLVTLSGKNLKVTKENGVVKVNGVTLTAVEANGTQSVYTVSVVLSGTATADSDKIQVFLPVGFVSKQVILSQSPSDTVPVKRFITTTSTISYLENTSLPLSVEEVRETNYSKFQITYNAAKVPTGAKTFYKSRANGTYKENARYEYVTNATGDVTRSNIFDYQTDTISGSVIGKYDYTYDAQNRIASIAKSVVKWDEAYTTTLTYAVSGNLSAYSSNNISINNLTFDTKNGIFKSVKKLYLIDRDLTYPWSYLSLANNLTTVLSPNGQTTNVVITYNGDNYPSKLVVGEEEYTITYRAFTVFK